MIAGDITTVDVTAMGQFDYIIARGVYSWAPEELHHAIAELLRPVREGRLHIELDDGQALTDEGVLQDVLTQYVAVLPQRLAEMKLGALG